MFECEILVGEGLGPIYACTTSAITEDEIAPLNHEVLDLFRQISMEIAWGVEDLCGNVN